MIDDAHALRCISHTLRTRTLFLLHSCSAVVLVDSIRLAPVSFGGASYCICLLMVDKERTVSMDYKDEYKLHSLMVRYGNRIIDTPYMDVQMNGDTVMYTIDCERCGDRFVSDVPVEYCTECVNRFDIKRVI